MNSRSETPAVPASGCRVCGSAEVGALPIGVYAPFFRQRVDISGDRHALYTARSGLPVVGTTGLTARLQRAITRLGERLLGSGQRTFLRTGCNFCPACRSLTLSHAYAYADLAPLYTDYRSAGYNRDRIAVEPSYAAIADQVGRDPREQASRNQGVAAFLQPWLPPAAQSKALDLGGSDGKFIPAQVAERYLETQIIDTSDAAVDDSVRPHRVVKVARPDADGYALVMCMHVLEHVGSPRQFVVDALDHLRPGGLLYLEVPLELEPGIPAQFEARRVDRVVTIHEHINQYHADSLTRLIASIAALRLLKTETATIDCGWSTGTVGRYLAQRVG